MTVAEVNVLVTGDDRGAQRAFERTKAGMGKLAKDGERVPGDGAKSWGDAVAKGMAQGSQKAGAAVEKIGGAEDRTADAVVRSMTRVGGSGEDAAKRLKAVEKTLGGVESTAKRVGVGLSAGLTTPLLLAGKAGLKYAGDLEQTLSVFRATANATASDMGKVGKAAEALGNDKGLAATSANDAARAMLELSKAGLSVKDTLGAARGVLEMSAAAQIDNATAAKIAADTLQSFGLAGTKANMVSDLLAASANASTASMSEMADGLSQASAVYAKAGISVQDLTTGLTMLANAGIKGSDAGTSMKTMLLSLENPTKEASVQLQRLGVNVYDARGKMLPFRAILAQLEVATKGLSDRQRNLALGVVFGSDAIRAASVIVGNGIGKFDALEKTVSKAGEAAKLAAANNAGFKGAVDQLGSAGQTLLSNFLTPSLPILTGWTKAAAQAVTGIGEWPESTKKTALAVGLFAGVVGPTTVAVGSFAGAIKSIIGLRQSFTAAQLAKAAATTATGTAAATAAVEETAAAGATTALASAATASIPALDAEAAALDTVATSATVAKGAIGSLGLAMAAITTAVAGWQIGTMIRGKLDEASQAAGYDDTGSYLYGKTGFDGSLAGVGKFFGAIGGGQEEGDDAVAAAGKPNAQFMRKWRRASAIRGAIGNANRAAASARSAFGFDRPAVPGQAVPGVLDPEIAAALANMNPDPHAGEKVKKGRKAGKSPEERAAEKAAREEAQAVASLKDQYYEAAKAVALYGKDKASVSLQYDLDHGKILRAGQAIAKDTIAQLKAKEALEARAEATKTAKDRAKEWTDAMIDHAKAILANTVGLSDQDRVAGEMFGKRFKDLTDEHNKQKVLWKIEEDRKAKEKELYDAGQSYAKDTIASLTHELNLKAALTRVDQARLDIAEHRAKGETITGSQEAAILDNARLGDVADWKAEVSDFGATLQRSIDDVVEKARKARADAAQAATDRYSQSMAELRERLAMTGDETAKTRERMVKLAEAFGTGATAADRIRSGMGRAQQVIALTLKVDRVEAFRSRMKGMADQVGGYFAQVATDVSTSFSLSFGGIVKGFGAMMANLARQQLAASIQHSVSSGVAGLLGGLFGGGAGSGVKVVNGIDMVGPFSAGAHIPGHATGGPVLAHRPIVVGENGPEMFVPSGDGSIATAAQTRKLDKGVTVNQTFHIAAPNPGAFHESMPQTMAKAGRAIRAATRSIG